MTKEPISPGRLKQLRDQVILYVYEHGAGNSGWGVNGDEVKHALKINDHEIQKVVMLMMEQGMLPTRGKITDIGLSERGQQEAIRLGSGIAMQEPTAPSQTVIHANYSIVQVAGANSSQNAQLSIDQSKFIQVIDEIEKELPSLNLQPLERTEAGDLLASLQKMITEKLPSAAVRATGAALAAIITAGGSKLGGVLMDLLHISAK